MSNFKKKAILQNGRVCLRLKQARVNCGVSLSTLSKRIKISKQHLQSLEECRFSDLGCAEIYQKNFIRKYVEALGLDPNPFMQQFSEEELKYKRKENAHPHIECGRRHFGNLPQALRYFLIGVMVCGVILYLGLQVRRTLEPPPLVVTTPPDGYVTVNNSVVVRGYTDPEVSITINGEYIMSGEQGTFSQDISLSSGINTIIISAIKKHGKVTEEARRIIKKEI